MTKTIFNSVRFMKIHLVDYGIFRGSNRIEFKKHQTLICGMNGTGKTTIANALAHLDPAPGVNPHILADSPKMSVEVETVGNRELIKQYADIIFLGCEFELMDNQEAIFKSIESNQHREEIKDEARSIFHVLLSEKPWKTKIPDDLNYNIMPASEKMCLGYAFAFAARKVLNIDIPCVFDSPYGMLDIELRDGVCAFLKKQSYQQIMLCSENEIGKEDKAHFTLNYINNSSQVIKNMI